MHSCTCTGFEDSSETKTACRSRTSNVMFHSMQSCKRVQLSDLKTSATVRAKRTTGKWCGLVQPSCARADNKNDRPKSSTLICSSTALMIPMSSDACVLSAAQRIRQYLLHGQPGHNRQPSSRQQKCMTNVLHIVNLSDDAETCYGRLCIAVTENSNIFQHRHKPFHCLQTSSGSR